MVGVSASVNLPLHHKIQIRVGLTFLVPAYPGCPIKEAVKLVSRVSWMGSYVLISGKGNFNSSQANTGGKSCQGELLIANFTFDTTPMFSRPCGPCVACFKDAAVY